MFRRGPESLGRSPEFKVETKDANLVYRWLDMKRQADNNPMLAMMTGGKADGKDNLALGRLVLRNGVLEGISAGVSYGEDEEYEMSAAFILSQQQGSPMPNVMQGGIMMIDPSMLRGHARGRQHEENFPNTNLFDVGSVLQEQLSRKGFDVQLDQETHEIVIRPLQGLEMLDDERLYKLHMIEGNSPIPFLPSNGPRALCLHLRDLIDHDPSVFEKKYKALGTLLKESTDAIYRLNRKSSPDKTFVMSPPRNTAGKLDGMDQVAQMRKKMLGTMGIIADGRELDEEIDSKIVLKERPETTFENIGGYDTAKEELEVVVNYMKNPKIFREQGAKIPRGVLLFGPPGTGKTLLAEATANAANASVFIVETADIVHSLYGMAEKRLDRIFERAREKAPAIIFMDELDALAAKRDHSTEVTSRIVSVMLTKMDGLKNDHNDGLVIIGATNRLDVIDPALLRPGRFNYQIPVEMPDESARSRIFRIHMGLVEKDAGRMIFDPSIDIAKLASVTENFSGADIEEIIRRVAIERVKMKMRGIEPGLTAIDRILEQTGKYNLIKEKKEKLNAFQAAIKAKNGSPD